MRDKLLEETRTSQPTFAEQREKRAAKSKKREEKIIRMPLQNAKRELF